MALNERIICWDFEGIGKHPIQVGVAELYQDKVQPLYFSNICTPKDLAIPSFLPAAKLNRRELENAPHLWELWPQLSQFWKCSSFVSHNLGTERKYLHAFPLHTPPGWIDTLKVYRFAYPDLPCYNLGELLHWTKLHQRALDLSCAFKNGEASEHDPVFDACGALLLLQHLLAMPGWETASVNDLQAVKPTKYYQRLAKKASLNKLKQCGHLLR